MEESREKILKWNFRGFDTRFICYNIPLINGGTDRFEVMQYLIPPNRENLVLIINRQSLVPGLYSSFLISDKIFDVKCLEGGRGGISYAIPLKINTSNEPNDFSQPKMAQDSNIKTEFKANLPYSEEIDDKDIFFYIYGVLNSFIYRKRYNKDLKKDFPRIPFPNKKDTFLKMTQLGKKLAHLHLFRSDELDPLKFPMSKSRDYRIHYIRRNDKDDQGLQIPDTYDPTTKRIYFKKRNNAQKKREKEGDNLDEITWIGNISQEMWNFEIGGRQQLKMWLYCRRYSEENKKNTISRALTEQELDYFLILCDTIEKTIKLIPEIDKVYEKIDPI